MSSHHLLSWKRLFYGGVLPGLRRLGPTRADAALGALGRLAGRVVPGRKRTLDRAAERAGAALGMAPGRRKAFRDALAEGVARHLARDYLLDGLDDDALAERFEVIGFEAVQGILAAGTGVILVGAHVGAHLAAVHWMARRGLPLRLLVQRPRHISATLDRWFDQPGGPHPQSAFFLRRGLPPAEAAARVLRARDVLRAGMAVYLNGDIPWPGPNARPGRLLGVERWFLATWADLAVLAPAPAVPVLCIHQPGGRYALTFGPPLSVAPGGQAAAVAGYLAWLDAAIAAQPAEAVPHWTWPAYAPPQDPATGRGPTRRRPGPIRPARP